MSSLIYENEDDEDNEDGQAEDVEIGIDECELLLKWIDSKLSKIVLPLEE